MKNNIATSKHIEETRAENQYAAAYLKTGVMHGVTYQIKMLTWVTWKLLCKSNDDEKMIKWFLAAEVFNARGFHDLVLKYIRDTPSGKRTLYRFVQIKHKMKLNDSSKISAVHIKSKKKKAQYSLIYLFKSYLNILNSFENVLPDQIVDMTVFTNVDIKNVDFLVPVETDKIFDFANRGTRYRIDLNLIQNNSKIITCLQQIRPQNTFILGFLSKLIFAVNQPSESELENLITEEMSKVFSVSQIFYNNFYKNIIEWFLIYENGKAPYLTEERALEYLRKTQSMLYDAKEGGLWICDTCELSKRLSALKI